MTSPLSNLVDNLVEGIHKFKCKDFDFFLEYEDVNENLMNYKCLSCNENFEKKIDENFKN